MFILAELKNPLSNFTLEAHIATRKAAEAKATAGKAGASSKPSQTPKVGKQDKANVTPTRSRKRQLEPLLVML